MFGIKNQYQFGNWNESIGLFTPSSQKAIKPDGNLSLLIQSRLIVIQTVDPKLNQEYHVSPFKIKPKITCLVKRGLSGKAFILWDSS